MSRVIRYVPLYDIEHGRRTSKEKVRRYTTAVLKGDKFPPVKLQKQISLTSPIIHEYYKICDGGHRVEAHRRAGMTHIKARFYEAD